MRLRLALLASATALLAAASPAAASMIVANTAQEGLEVTGGFIGDTMQIDFVPGGATGSYVITVSPVSGPAPPGYDQFTSSTGCTLTNNNRTATCPRLLDANGDVDLFVDMSSGNDVLGAGYGSADLHPDDFLTAALGDGDDVFGGSALIDRVFGGPGNDQIDGAGGDDQLTGSTGFGSDPARDSDTIFGGPGSDVLDDGDETGNIGPDVLDGGGCSAAANPLCVPQAENPGDDDLANYLERDNAVTIDLRAATPIQGEAGEGDTIRNTESVFTGEGDDKVTGNGAFNDVYTSRGNDSIDVSGDSGSGDSADCGEGADGAKVDADDDAFGCETVEGGSTGGGNTGGGNTGGGGTTGGGSTGGGSTGGGTTGGGTSPPPADTAGPTVVVAAAKALTASKTGAFAFGVGPFAEDVAGTVEIRSSAPVKATAAAKPKKVVLKLGTRSFTAAAGKKVAVAFKLSPKNRKVLAKRKKVAMVATVVARDKAGNATTRKVAFSLKAPRKRR